MSEKESIAVSVIIPVHNAAGYISDTLSTVLSQTLNDIEIIIVNDCSDDNTLEIVSALAETDSRIRVTRQILVGEAQETSGWMLLPVSTLFFLMTTIMPIT